MVHQTNTLLSLQYDHLSFLWFVFSATMASYNFHWLLTTETHPDSVRLLWTRKHRNWHILFFIAGCIAAVYFGLRFLQYWPWLLLAGLLTFIYSAPKIPFMIFTWMRNFVYAKTIFLAVVWTYVTTVLPIVINHFPFRTEEILFIIMRFFLIYSICIIFDLRDREQDNQEGIRSLITTLSLHSIDRLFYACITVFLLACTALYFYGFGILLILLLMIPGIITALLYPFAKRNTSDYFYYFLLDGLMMLSALLTLFIPF